MASGLIVYIWLCIFYPIPPAAPRQIFLVQKGTFFPELLPVKCVYSQQDPPPVSACVCVCSVRDDTELFQSAWWRSMQLWGLIKAAQYYSAWNCRQKKDAYVPTCVGWNAFSSLDERQIQSWALAVFFNFLINKKLYFLPFLKYKPKMVNAPEGLNQVILRKMRRFRCLCLFAKNDRLL